MQKKARQYSAEEKTKVVLETIKGELSMAQISSKYGIHTTQITNWKKQGIELLIQGFKGNKSTGDPNQQQQELVKNLYEQIGQLTVERDWLKKNLNCLDLKVRCSMISRDNQLTIKQQCELLSINRATYSYKPNNALDENDLKVMTTIDENILCIHILGHVGWLNIFKAKVLNIERKGIRRYYRIMGIEAVYPKMNLSKRNQSHKVYPYLLKDLDVTYSNQVWCADITYIRLQQGFVVYLVDRKSVV